MFSYFRMNPADARLAVRCSEVSDFFDKREKEASSFATAEDLAKYSDELAEKIDYILGYKASETLFGELMSPVTILPNGDIFAFVVLETIGEAVGTEIKKRKRPVDDSASDHVFMHCSLFACERYAA